MEIGVVGYNRPITLLGLGFAELNPNLCTRQSGQYRVKTCIGVDGFSLTDPNVYGAFNRMKSPAKTGYLSLILIISIWHCVLKKEL